MKSKILYISCLAALLWSACAYDEIQETEALDEILQQKIEAASYNGSTSYFILPDETDFANIPQDPQNPITAVKVALGQYLFFETGLAKHAINESSIGTYSCGTCHVPSAGFRPGRIQGIADGGLGFGVNGEGRRMNPEYLESELDAQGARPLSVLNVGFVTNTFWNGQFGAGGVNEGTEHLWNEEDKTAINHTGLEGLEAQTIEGLEVHRMDVSYEVIEELGYLDLYNVAFKDIPPNERFTPRTASFAISAYLRTLLTNKAPFQNWLRGNNYALSTAEKRGAILFFDKANCYTCHNSPGLSATAFYGIGVKDLHEAGGLATSPEDRRNLGRGGFTGAEDDMFKFKVPQLYNLKDAPFYFHGSSKESLEEVVEYFDQAIPENGNVPASQISPKFRPLNLTDQEKADLLAFLKNGLHDPFLDRYVPPFIKSGNCYPNNDSESIEDTGCQ